MGRYQNDFIAWFKKHIFRKKVLTKEESFKLEQREFVAKIFKSTMMFFDVLHEAERNLGWSRKKRKQVWRDLEKGHLEGKLIEEMQKIIEPILSAAKAKGMQNGNKEDAEGLQSACEAADSNQGNSD